MSYIDSTTGNTIDDNSIISNTNSGIISVSDNSWKYTPADQVSDDNTDIIDNSYNATDLLDKSITEETVLDYAFSLNNIKIQNKSIKNVYGIVSNDISLNNFSYLKIDANILENDNSSYELSIIDGSTDIPILPISCTQVNNEKLIQNMSTRFYIDTSYSVNIKKNGVYYSNNYTSFDKSLLSSSDVYTISYTPLNSYKKTVSNSIIRLKLIIRIYDKGYPPSISNIILKKYGGTLEWIY